MPAYIGSVYLPRRSPHFADCRRAVRNTVAATSASRVAIGLSGGADSLALVAAACAEGLDVTALCVDHQLQPGSDAIAASAAKTARSMGASAEVLPVTVDNATGEGMEAAARTARYAALRLYAGSRPLWVAHTLDDQAETLLLGVLRGKATGMSRIGRSVVRPFLGLRRSDTYGACRELGLEPWEDPHNSDARFRRVALRTQIIPQLSALVGGDVIPPLAQAAQRAHEDDAFIATHLPPPSPELDCAVSELPRAVRTRSILSFLRGHNIQPSTAVVEAIDALIVDWHGQGGVAVGRTATGARLVVRRKNGTLFMDQSQ